MVNMVKESIYKEFGREVRRRREALGLTLEQLGVRSGLTPNYIGGVELGKRDPSLTTIRALGHGLNASAGELLGTVVNLSLAATDVARLFLKTPPALQRAILDLLRTVVAKKRDAGRSKHRRRN